MADLEKSAPAKRALPFKRTARPKPPSDAKSTTDDDGLALFSQSKNYFPTVVEDQQRRAREKAEKAEQERIEKLAREREEKEAKAREAELRREKRRKEAEEREKESESAKKRRRNSLLSDDEHSNYKDKDATADEDEDDVFSDPYQTSDKPSTPFSPSTRRSASAPRHSAAPESARKTRASRPPEEMPVVLLDSSDDEDPTRRGSDLFGTRSRRSSSIRKGKAKAEDSDSDIEMWEEKKEDKEGVQGGEGEDPSEFYIKAAMERMRKAKEARLARGSSAAGDGNNETPTPSANDDAPVSVMIAAPALPDAKVLCCTVRTTQALQIAFDTFKERQKSQTTYPHKMISELVFTWRGDRVYYTTKLETLGIRPRGADGRLHDSTNTHSGRSGPEGYVGKDKVYFEAWSPEDYEENQQKQERERKRREMGEWWEGEDTANIGLGGNDDDQEADAEESQQQKEDDRVKVIFKAKDMPPRNVTLRKYSTVAHMIKAFRKLAGIGEDKHIEIRWDGETLDLETTVEEADIGDMDSVEVHIR